MVGSPWSLYTLEGEDRPSCSHAPPITLRSHRRPAQADQAREAKPLSSPQRPSALLSTALVLLTDRPSPFHRRATHPATAARPTGASARVEGSL